MPLDAYSPGELIPPGMTQWVRDILGVDAFALPESFFAGFPAQRLLAAANRRVPGWALLTQAQRADFDQAATLFLCKDAVEQRLRTLYAKGEGTQDARAGDYDWTARAKALTRAADAAWNRCAQANGATATDYKPFQPYGRSKRDAFTSPDVLVRLGWPWI